MLRQHSNREALVGQPLLAWVIPACTLGRTIENGPQYKLGRGGTYGPSAASQKEHRQRVSHSSGYTPFRALYIYVDAVHITMLSAEYKEAISLYRNFTPIR
ncbi:hypothetical protein HNQ08_003057 [Deinococcus humi]|uniref:Uncharacterized protein n=1 Tax=Deinococcus humi TaxID=662880 RepID=A0A7W8JVE0_9DEIO|nr:hypothetical protein [Deinococcus humi]